MAYTYIPVTASERREIEEARDAFHTATLAVLKAHGQDATEIDLTHAGEHIALEGVIPFEN